MIDKKVFKCVSDRDQIETQGSQEKLPNFTFLMYNHCVALKPITKPLSQGSWGRQEPTKQEPNRRQVTEKGMVFKTLQ